MNWRLSICFIKFSFLFIFSTNNSFVAFYFCLNDLVYFIEWQVVSLSSLSIVMTF